MVVLELGGGMLWRVFVREVEICAMWDIAGSRVEVVGVSGSIEERICFERVRVLVYNSCVCELRGGRLPF